MAIKALVLFALIGTGVCLRKNGLQKPRHHLPARHESDCWKKRPVSRHLTPQHRHMASLLGTKHGNWSHVLGFGVNESAVEPFVTVQKDGYMLVDCVQDKMMKTADKHGDGKWDYKNHAGVSILFYDRIITDPEEKKPMTPEVCYQFCRTIPDAGFFGLAAGRKCYCAPYFEQEASDSSTCDAVCEGDQTQMCGGMVKQSMYEMHMCNDAAQDITVGNKEGTEALNLCTNVNGNITNEIATLQALGDEMKTRFGTNGDPMAAAHGQLALEYIGMLNDGWSASDAMMTDLGGLTGQLNGLQGANFKDPAVLTKAEELMSETKELAAKATEMCSPYEYFGEGIANGTDALKAYHPITYWTAPSEDRVTAADFATAPPSACEGAPPGGPRIVSSIDECANLCDAKVTPPDNCIGFQYYESATGGLCSYLNDITGLTYYSESDNGGMCATTADSVGDGRLVCAAKLAKMKGFDASGAKELKRCA